MGSNITTIISYYLPNIDQALNVSFVGSTTTTITIPTTTSKITTIALVGFDKIEIKLNNV